MWLLIGLILGTGLVALMLWLRTKKVAVRWYEGLLAVVGLFLMLFAYENYRASMFEYETFAAGWLLLIFGLPGLLLLAISVVLVWQREFRRNKNQKKTEVGAVEAAVG